MRYVVSGCNDQGDQLFEVTMSSRPSRVDIENLVQGKVYTLLSHDGGFVTVDGRTVAAVGVRELH